MCNAEMVKFHVDSFLGTLVDYGAVKHLGEIGFVQFKLRENMDELEVEI